MKFAASLSKLLAAMRASEPSARSATAVTPAPLIVALEPRIVYDASAASIGAAVAAQHHQASAEAGAASVARGSAASAAEPGLALQSQMATAAARAVDSAAAQARAVHGYMPPGVGAQAAIVVPRQGDAASANGGAGDAPVFRAVHGFTDAVASAADKQVVFINSNVSDYQTLIAGLPQGTQYVILDSTKDGLAQIEQYLQQHPGVGAIHLVSHGSDGLVQVGSTWLNQGDLSAYSAELSQIGAAMKPGADFLIYGCDVAQNADGKAFVQQIAAITGLNVAASTDATGASSLGGDWTLEYDAGAVHTGVIFSAAAERAYDRVLAVYDETYDADVGFDTGPTGVTSTTLDGLVYTGDQPVEYNVYGGASLPNSNSGGELIVNGPGTPMSTLTIQRQDGALMASLNFDIDIFVSNDVTVQGLDSSGAVVGTIDLNVNAGATAYTPGHTASSTIFHVDLSSNPAFSQIKSLKFIESSGNGTPLAPILDNIVYLAPSSPPALTATGGSTAFVAGDNVASTPVAVDAGITLTDGNSSTAVSATVSITGNLHTSEDRLAFTNTSAATYGNIASSYNTSTGVLTLTSASGTASIAQWQAALRAVTYTDTAVTPNTATRGIAFQVTNDGYTAGNSTSKSVTVADTDQTPKVTTASHTVSYQAGGSNPTIDTSITVTDLDNTTQSSGTVSISGGFHSGDALNFTNDGSTMGNISGSYNAGTGVLTLISAGATATDAQWQHALAAVTFSSTSTTLGNRTISFATSDGTKTSAAATDTVNVISPVQVTTDSGSAAFVAGDNATSAPVAVDSGLTVTDTAATTLGSATVAITGNFQSTEDALAFTNDGSTMGNITGSYNTGTGILTLTSASATATLAQWQSALRSVTYTDTVVTPNNATRTVAFTVVDGLGNTSATSTRTVTVTDTDQTPIVHATGGTTNYVGASAGVTIDSHVTVSDLDNTTQTSATVAVTTGFHTGDVLSFTNDGSTMGNIQASYSAGSGVLLLTSIGGTATNAQWASALSSVTFSSTSTTYGNRTIWYQVNDGTKNSAQAADTVHMTAPPAITTDSGSAAFVAGDNVPSTPVAIDSGLTVTDGSAATFASATVAITGGFQSAEDQLAFANDGATMGNIAASYNATTGVMTLTSSGATATLAQWQSALQSITYTDTAVIPNNATRTISFTAVDGAGNTSATATRTVTVTDTDQTPKVSTTGGTTNYVAGTAAATIDGGITVSDADNTTQSSATVSITGGFHSGDVLSFTNTNSTTFGNIVGSYNSATGVLTLTSSGATAIDAQWSNALSAVTFSAGASATPGNRTVSFATSDGTKTSATATDTVTVLGPPTITTDSGSAAFVAGDNTASTPVAIDSGLTLSDGVAPTLASATVAITGNFHSGEDVLAFTNSNATTFGNIAASYNAATGVLTLTSSGATATLAQWQAALDAVTYTDTAVTPNNATRTISFSAVDSGANTSNTATRTVTVTDTDQTPIVSTTGGTANYVGGTSAVTIDGGVTVTDHDNTTQASGTVAITGGFHSGDTLAFVNTNSATFGNIVGSYNAATGVLTLISSGATSSDAQWSNALSAVTFSAGASATPGNRTVSFAVNDGTKTSAIKTDTVAVLGPPTITTDSGSAAFVAGDNTASTPVAIDSGLTLTDGSAPTLASATVAITGNFQSGEDVLAFTNSNGATFGNIAASYNTGTGVLTLTSSGATATLAQWQAALDAVTYTDTAVTPNNSTRTISFSAVDTGAYTSNTATRTVTVTDTDQTPIVSTTGGTTNYVGGTSAVTIDGGITVSDLDNTTQSLGFVSITSGFHSGDTLSFINTSSVTFGNIVGSYNAATGVLTLTSSGATSSDAQWSNALSAVKFSASASATPGNRTVSFTTNDGTKDSAAATRTVDLLDPPTITTDAGSAAFVAGDNAASTPVAIDSGLTLTDGGAPTLASATVAITGNFHSGEDVLAFTNNNAATFGDISASYNAATGVLTLTSSGSSTLAQWQAALDAVTYADTAVTPNNATRTISFTAIDSAANASNTATRTVTVADTDQTPIVTATRGTASYVTGATAAIVNPNVTVTDLDNTTQSSGTVSIASNFHSGEDVLSFTNTNAASFGNIAGTFNAATGVLTLTSSGATATDAQWANALSAVTFASNGTHFGNRTVSFATSDGVKTSAAASATVSFVDKPHVTLDSGAASFVAADNAPSTPVAIAPGLTLADASTTLSSASVAITGGFHAGQDVLTFTNDGATMGNIAAVYDANTGVLTLTSAGGTATLAQWRSALASVTYTDTAVKPDSTARTISFTVTDGNGTASDATSRAVTVTDTDQTPTIAVSGNATFTWQATGSTPVAVAPQVTVGDRDATATLTSAQVRITGGFDASHDTLALAGGTAAGGITASYDAATGVLTLTSSSATLAQWQSALQSVTYSNSQFRATGSRTLSYTISDGVKTSVAAASTVTIVAGPSGGTPTAALPVTTTPAAAASTATGSFATGPDNTAPPDVLDELGATRTIGSVPAVPTMTFSDPNAHTSAFSLNRATVSRFDATALNAALAVTPSPLPTSFSDLAVPVPEHDPFSIDVATLLPPSQAMGGGAFDVTVRLADGRSLPGWLHYDAANGALRGKVPAGVQDVRIVVEARDASGHIARREVVLAPHARGTAHDIAHPARPGAHAHTHSISNGHAVRGAGQPLAARPAGKPSLDQQFAQARAALHVQRPSGAVRRV
ncbi:DUF4347 domain-containing protein [Trinickia diaoshuihuensis]|uniref:DUF4347 domain-containing protein n=1 Tax=Trinickia diaoshuihuensis TaxID=2292265 RepID=UPI0013C33016|nr:DUF4347 domain-containing protein [Trinickia diaoshuihuensis]